MIQGITFDIHALLVGPPQSELLAQILHAEGIGASAQEVADSLGRLPVELATARAAMRTEEQENDYHRALWPTLLTLLGVPHPTDALLMRLVESLHEYHAYFSMYPEVLPVLEELKRRGLRMGIVANWEPSLGRLLREFELDGYFGTIISANEVGMRKPDPFVFHGALKGLGLTADDVLHVGPSMEEDVTGAIRSGLRPVWVNRTGIPTGFEVLTITDLRGLLLLVGKAEG